MFLFKLSRYDLSRLFWVIKVREKFVLLITLLSTIIDAAGVGINPSGSATPDTVPFVTPTPPPLCSDLETGDLTFRVMAQ